MKTSKNWLAACVAMILSLRAATVQAAVINYVGSQTDLGPSWRTSSVQKPLDIDNNNVLGTDGYDVINRPAALPSYVSQMTILSSTTGGDPSYAFIDNPTSLPATFQTGTMNPSPGLGASANLFSFTVNGAVNTQNGSVISRRIRVGLLVDNLDNPAFNAASLTLVQTSGPGAGSATAPTTSASFNDQVPDWIFFDITGAAAGNTFVIRGVGGSSGYATLGGVAFDSSTQALLVTNLSDNGGPGTLRGVLAAGSLAANDLVQFSTNLSGQTILLTNGEILLSQNVTIDATALPGGIQINGNTNSRIFEVASNATVTLNELTITNGYGTNGGGIYNSGTLTLNECTVAGNSVTNGVEIGEGAGAGKAPPGGGGGGIYNGVGALTLNECTVSGNSAAIYGGGIFNSAGGTPGTLILNECTLSGNSAIIGGGIFNSLNTLTLNQCTLSGNLGRGAHGGGIASGMDTVAEYNSIVAGNTPDNMYAVGSTNIFTGVNLTNGTPLLAPLGNYGGPTQTMPPLPGSPAIDAGSDAATNLFATDQRGFSRLSGLHVDIGAVEVQVTMVNNALDTGTGSLREAIAQTSTNPVLVTFNPALSGQTIKLTSGELLLSNNLTIDATALPGGIQINGNGNSRIFEVATDTIVTLNGLTITNGLTFLHNSVPTGFDGGGIFNSGTLTLNECTLAGNSVTNLAADGGGICNYKGTLTVNECTLAGNSAGRNGGGIANVNGMLMVNQCTMSGNSAASSGGGISDLGTVTVYNSIIAGNSGDDIYAESGTNIFTGVNLTNGTPLLAPLGNYGGTTQTMPPLPGSPAIDAGSDAATNLFATDQRGFPRLSGLHVDIGAAELQVTIVSNTFDTGAGSLRQAIAQAPTNFGMDTITFAPNLSGQTILLTSGELLLSNNLTIDATALPGGIQINGNGNSRIFEVGTDSIVTLNGLTITNGDGGKAGNGGGVYNSGTLTLNECTVSGNSAPAGGGICNGLGTMTLNECTVVGNSALLGGGGIYNDVSGGLGVSVGALTLNECTLSGNSVPNSNGGGIYNGFNTLTVNQCTVSGNSVATPNGGGIYIHYGMSTVYNSIIAGNTDTGSDFYAPAGTNNFMGVNLTNGTPLLAPLGNYGGLTQTMPPLPGSPAIDAGSDAATNLFATDQRGFPRLSGLQVDIGAVEVQFTTLVVSNTLDSVPGSLRQTITQAATNLSIATITFAPNLSGQTITLTSGEVLLNNTLTIDASALPQGIQINGNANDRIFEVDSLGPVTLNSLTLTNGSANDGYGGGGILSYSSLTLNECTLAGNAAGGNVGGGVENEGTNTLNECTLAGNSAGIGGGLFNYGNLTLNQCTVSGNSAISGYGGGGVFNFGDLTLTGSIVAANTASVGADLFNEESLTYSGANLIKNVVNLGPSGSVTGPAPINATALLAPLGNYGGPTPTLPPLPNSPAIDAAGTTVFTTDQRGFPRVVGYGPDLGAVEGVYNPAGPGKLGEVTLLGNGAVQFGFTNYSDMSFTVLASTNVALPLNLWTSLGIITETSDGSGQYQFSDPQATNYMERFYRVQMP